MLDNCLVITRERYGAHKSEVITAVTADQKNSGGSRAKGQRSTSPNGEEQSRTEVTCIKR